MRIIRHYRCIAYSDNGKPAAFPVDPASLCTEQRVGPKQRQASEHCVGINFYTAGNERKIVGGSSKASYRSWQIDNPVARRQQGTSANKLQNGTDEASRLHLREISFPGGGRGGGVRPIRARSDVAVVRSMTGSGLVYNHFRSLWRGRHGVTMNMTRSHKNTTQE